MFLKITFQIALTSCQNNGHHPIRRAFVCCCSTAWGRLLLLAWLLVMSSHTENELALCRVTSPPVESFEAEFGFAHTKCDVQLTCFSTERKESADESVFDTFYGPRIINTNFSKLSYGIFDIFITFYITFVIQKCIRHDISVTININWTTIKINIKIVILSLLGTLFIQTVVF